MGGINNGCYWIRYSWLLGIAGSNNIDPPLYHNQDLMPSIKPHKYSIVDTGSTVTYISPTNTHIYHNIYPTTNSSTVKASDYNYITPTHTAALHLLPHLSDHAQQSHVFNSLKTGSLISIRHIRNDNWAAIFSKYNVKIIKYVKLSSLANATA